MNAEITMVIEVGVAEDVVEGVDHVRTDLGTTDHEMTEKVLSHFYCKGVLYSVDCSDGAAVSL